MLTVYLIIRGTLVLLDFHRLAYSAVCFPIRFPVDIFFTPKQEGDVNFNLICNIKKKAHPLTLNVKAEGYTMNAEVKCRDRMGSTILLSSSQVNTINFYEVRDKKDLTIALPLSRECDKYNECELSLPVSNTRETGQIHPQAYAVMT